MQVRIQFCYHDFVITNYYKSFFVIQLSDWGNVFLFFAAGLRPSLLSKSAVKFECGELGFDVGATGCARRVEVRTDRCVDSCNVSPHLPIT